MKLKNKLFLAQIIVVALMFVTMTLALSQIVYMTRSQNDRDNAMILNEQIMTQIDQYFEELERFTAVTADDEELKELIRDYMEMPSAGELIADGTIRVTEILSSSAASSMGLDLEAGHTPT